MPAPVRFLPAFDSIILAHRDRSRIVPTEYIDAVFNKRNATTKNTFTVDGFVAGAWRVETQAAACSSRSRRCRRACGARWTPKASGCSPGISARREERQLGLALAAQDGEVDLDAGESALLGQRDRLRLDLLRDEDAAAVGARGSTRMQSR